MDEQKIYLGPDHSLDAGSMAESHLGNSDLGS
jgi:hypothetical protein